MMTLTITPELEQKIEAEAFARGLSNDVVALEALDRGLLVVTNEPAAPVTPSTDMDWPADLYEAARLHPSLVLLPKKRPTAASLANAFQTLAGTDRPAKDYPDDFFSREVIYADHD